MKKSNIKSTLRNIIDGFLVFFVFITTTVYALPSNGVTYDNSNSGSTATTVNEALDDLYTKVNDKQTEIDRINGIGNATANHILNGKTALVKGQTITGNIPSKGAATYTPSTSNQTIASGNYLSGVQTIKGDANLVAENIAKGKSIFGVAGTYTSDANAAAANILSGKTAYVNGSKISGTIPNKGATTYTPNTKDQSISSGNYLSGAQTIKGDANLIAGNIAKGKSIFGVTGTYTNDATATASDIKKGETAYVNGNKIIGIANLAGLVNIEKVETGTTTFGYSNGNQKVTTKGKPKIIIVVRPTKSLTSYEDNAGIGVYLTDNNYNILVKQGGYFLTNITDNSFEIRNVNSTVYTYSYLYGY